MLEAKKEEVDVRGSRGLPTVGDNQARGKGGKPVVH